MRRSEESGRIMCIYVSCRIVILVTNVKLSLNIYSVFVIKVTVIKYMCENYCFGLRQEP